MPGVKFHTGTVQQPRGGVFLLVVRGWVVVFTGQDDNPVVAGLVQRESEHNPEPRPLPRLAIERVAEPVLLEDLAHQHQPDALAMALG
jgi:hypothetical protein